MYKQILDIVDSLALITKYLPSSWSVSLYLKILKTLFWYETKLLDHYIQILLNSKDYYTTLNLINTNNWCPENFSLNFIKYVQEHHSNLVHA
jgi:hypothetical protein